MDDNSTARGGPRSRGKAKEGVEIAFGFRPSEKSAEIAPQLSSLGIIECGLSCELDRLSALIGTEQGQSLLNDLRETDPIINFPINGAFDGSEKKTKKRGRRDSTDLDGAGNAGLSHLPRLSVILVLSLARAQQQS